MGDVVQQTRFWNRVPRTQTEQAPTVIQRSSLDTLTAQVVNAQNRLVHCQCETAKAEVALEEAQRTWATEILERGQQLGIAEFCQIKTGRRRIEEET
jgi:hypothetical protein